MTNIYFWGKLISPSFQNQSKNHVVSLVSVQITQNVKTVECGAESAFLLSDTNELYAFGSNQHGQIGLTYNAHRGLELCKIFVPTKTKIVSISCGWYHTLILDQLGSLYSSGSGAEGAIGQNTRQNSYGFKQIMTGVRKASAGLDHSLAIKGNKVFGWGNTQDGQLGLHTKKRIVAPKQLNIYPCQQIFAGPKYSIFLTVKGVYVSGMNNNFQLGLGHNKDVKYPKLLQINDRFVNIWGGNYCFAKNKSDQVYLWGSGAFGVIRYPIKIPFFQRFDHLSLGLNFGIVQKSQKIYVWGSNNFGQLGTQSEEIKNYPDQSLNLSKLGLASFACGNNFAVGIRYSDQNQDQNKQNSVSAKNQIIEKFYVNEDFEPSENQKQSKQSLYSSFEYNPKRSQNQKIFNQSVRLGHNNNIVTSSLKRHQKNRNNHFKKSNSEKEKSTSDATDKKTTVINFGCKKIQQNRQKTEETIFKFLDMDQLPQQLSELKVQVNHSLNEENVYLKWVLKEYLKGDNDSGKDSATQLAPQDLKREYSSINQLVKNNSHLQNLLGVQSDQDRFSSRSQGQSQVGQVEEFSSKLRLLKSILHQLVHNNQNSRNSLIKA